MIDDHTEDEQWVRIGTMGRTHLATIAVSDSEEVVAYTYFAVPTDGDWCFQDATLVVPAHRWMVAINNSLSYRPVEASAELSKTLRS